MKNLLILALTLMSLTAYCQTNDVVVFSEKGETFTLYVNSVKQNDVPQANVRAEDLRGESLVLRVVFEDKAIPELTQNVWTENKDVEITAIVKQNKKGKYVLRYMGETPRANVPVENDEETYVNYEDPNASGYEPEETVTSNTTTETVTTTTTVTTGDNTDIDGGGSLDVNLSVNDNGMSVATGDGRDQVNMDLSVGENGMSVTAGDGEDQVNMNISVNENGMGVSTGTGEDNVNVNFSINTTGMDTNVGTSESMTTTTTTTSVTTTTNAITSDEVYTEEFESDYVPANTRCPYPMSSTEFDEAMHSVKSKTFEDDKYIVAKQICKANCMTSEQIRDMNKVFDFEDTRLDFAKYAYDYVYDNSKYYKVNDSFEFEMTIDELDEYLENK